MNDIYILIVVVIIVILQTALCVIPISYYVQPLAQSIHFTQCTICNGWNFGSCVKSLQSNVISNFFHRVYIVRISPMNNLY